MLMAACTPTKPIEPIDPIDPPLKNDDLYQYKYEAMTEVNDYMVAEYAKDKYSQEDKAELIDIVDNFIAQLKNTEDKAAVDSLKNKAKDDMDNLSKSMIKGQFLTLRDAYNRAQLTKEDLTAIAKGETKETLDSNIENLIKYTRYTDVNNFLKNEYFRRYTPIELKDVTIEKFYGKFGDLYVVSIDDPWIEGNGDVKSTEIDGVKIESANRIIAWSNKEVEVTNVKGKFYTFQEAYDKSILKVDDLKEIANHTDTYSAGLAYSVIPRRVYEMIENVYYEEANDGHYEWTLKDVYIRSLHGCYNGAYVVSVVDLTVSYTCDVAEEVVGGVTIVVSARPVPIVFVLE